jgi:hypothetical protein
MTKKWNVKRHEVIRYGDQPKEIIVEFEKIFVKNIKLMLFIKIQKCSKRFH